MNFYIKKETPNLINKQILNTSCILQESIEMQEVKNLPPEKGKISCKDTLLYHIQHIWFILLVFKSIFVLDVPILQKKKNM